MAYAMPILVIIPFMNADGWYGTGLTGGLQRVMQMGAFFTGAGCAHYGLLRGSKWQRLAVLPVALSYDALVMLMLFDRFIA